MASSFSNYEKAFQSFLKKNTEKNIPIKSLLILLATSIIFMFSILFLVVNKSDRITQQSEDARFEHLLKTQQDNTKDLVNALLSLPGTQEMLHDKLSKQELNDKITQRLADGLSTTNIYITNEQGNILLSDTSFLSIYPLNLSTLKHNIDTLVERVQVDGDKNFLSDLAFINGDLFSLSIKEVRYSGQLRFLIVATPLTQFIQKSQTDPIAITPIENAKILKPHSSLVVIPLNNLETDTIGWVSWQRNLPARSSLLSFIPILLSATILLTIIAFVFWKQAKILTKSITKTQENAKKLALHDPLTGLANRALLKQQIAAAKSHVKRGRDGFALHLIDLDKFKDVNDTMGHPAGDELIKQAADRLKDACRASDTVARIGGDEFAVIQLEATNTSVTSRLARRINEQMARAFKINGNEVFVSASIGIAHDHNGTCEHEELVRRADIALYRSKGNGKNQFCFFEAEMDAELKNKHAIERDLRQALQNPIKNGLRVVYQPQVSANGRHIRGMEALIRWTHPTRGIVSPADFIPVAEESNLVVQLDNFVLRQAFKTATSWPEITMAVNVSAKELHYDGYAKRVIATAEEFQVRPDQIELEITESVLLEDSPRIAKTLKQLKAVGFKIALDDFGTGYSSLSYLRRHQVDKLKIDQSFVASIGVRDDASAVVQAILSLGESLGLSVTAEGVETIEQRDSLRAHGCAYLQGYLFSRPIEEDAIASLVAQFKQRNDKERVRKIS